MSDIRERLNARRSELTAGVHKAEERVEIFAADSSFYQQGSRWIQELLQIELILAQMQNADAQRELAQAQREVADAQRKATEAGDKEREWSEGRTFWLRRFFTSVAVANGAGAFASLSALLGPDHIAATPAAVRAILFCFMGGVAIAGLLPIILAFRPYIRFDRWPWPPLQWAVFVLTLVAAGLFIAGTWQVLQVGFATYDMNALAGAAAAATN